MLHHAWLTWSITWFSMEIYLLLFMEQATLYERALSAEETPEGHAALGGSARLLKPPPWGKNISRS